MFDITYLYLIGPIIGFTSALTSLFPRILGTVKPFVALLVAYLLYLGVRNLEPALFGLLIATGTAMGLYKLSTNFGNQEVKIVK